MNRLSRLVLLILPLFFVSTLYAADTTNIGKLQLAQAPADKNKNGNTDDDDDFTKVDEKDTITIADPFEQINRGVFWFNDKFYFYLLKPVARGYRAVVPEKARISVSNFFSNLAAPIRIVNSALQLKGDATANASVRFILNSTIGLVGLFDVAKNDFKIQPVNEDFGQTLGHYGIGNGNYVVLPFLGPSTTRDSLGLLVDSAIDPVYRNTDTREYIGIRFVDTMNEVSLDKDTYEAIKKEALDPYLFIRNAYIQHRQGLVNK